MPRPKKPAATPRHPPYLRRRPPIYSLSQAGIDRSAITHERIAADLEGFPQGRRQIEVLGVTRSLKKIGPDADDARPRHP